MAGVLDPTWGPYRGPDDARAMLAGFVDKACGPGVGIVWAANGNLYPLRAPGQTFAGLRDVAAFQWSPLPPPPPKPPVGFWQKLKSGLEWCMEQEGRAALQEAASNRAMAESMNQMLSRVVHSHRDDGLGVALDILAIGLSLALLPTGLGALGALGLAAGAVLLVTDGAAYAMELGGDDEGAEAFKKRTEPYRIIATIATLPDVGWNGVKLIKEMREVQAMRLLDRTTAAAADAMATRTANASRAARFQNIAERAHLRAQLRTEQLAAAMKLEVTGKGTGAGSAGLLVREEWLNDESMAHSIARRLQIHCTTVHR